MASRAKNINFLSKEGSDTSEMYKSMLLLMEMGQNAEMRRSLENMFESNNFAGAVSLLGKRVAIKSNNLHFQNGKAFIKYDGQLNGAGATVELVDANGHVVHSEKCKLDNEFIILDEKQIKNSNNKGLKFKIISSNLVDLTSESYLYMNADFVEYKQKPGSQDKVYYI